MSDSEIEDVFHGFPDDSPCPAGFSRYCPEELQIERAGVQELLTILGEHSTNVIVKKKKSGKHSVKASRKAGPVKKKRSCGKCDTCIKPDCGSCVYCHDKPKFGGPSTLRQRCIERNCPFKVIKNARASPVWRAVDTQATISALEREDSHEELDVMLEELLTEGVHKEHLFKDLLVYKYWKLRPEPSPEELISLSQLLNMTMEGIQEIISHTNDTPTPSTDPDTVDSNTAREKISEFLTKYPKVKLESRLSQSDSQYESEFEDDVKLDIGDLLLLNTKQPKQLKLEIKRSASKDGNQTDTMLLHKDSAKLTELSSKDLVKYEEHSTGLFVPVPVWLEALQLYLLKKDLLTLCDSRGLRQTKVKKLETALITGQLPERVVQCLVDHCFDCPRYMSLSEETLAYWATRQSKVTSEPTNDVLGDQDQVDDVVFKLPVSKKETKESQIVSSAGNLIAEIKSSKRYVGTVGKRGTAKAKKVEKPKKEVERKVVVREVDAKGAAMVSLHWRTSHDLETVWTEGCLIPTTEYGSMCPELCYLCGSAGLGVMIYCSTCSEPFHRFCLDIEELDVITCEWRCERCLICDVCYRGTEEMLLKCCVCYLTFHSSCLPLDSCTSASSNGVWKCPTCLVCNKCGTKHSPNHKWLFDFSLCKPCGIGYSKGNYCPLCEAVYQDEDYDTPMVSCNTCTHWVHIECDNITELEYEAMSNLPEDRVVYICRRCSRDSAWRDQMIQCLQENMAHCLEAMSGVVESRMIRVHKYTSVKSVRQFELDMYQYLAHSVNAVKTFRTVLDECFPWYSKTKPDQFTAPTPTKTPLKKSLKNWELQSYNDKKPQTVKSSSLLPLPDSRQCVLCNCSGDGFVCGPGRLLMCGVDQWIHVNCALWSSEVYEEADGRLMNVEVARNRGASLRCDQCGIYGATIGCCDKSCPRSYHFACGIKSGAVFLVDKRLFCAKHKVVHYKPHWETMQQISYIIDRRMYVDPAKIRSTKRNSRPMSSDTLFPHIGASRISKIGKITNLSDHSEMLAPYQYTCERLFWSFREQNTRCLYRCTILKEAPSDPDQAFPVLSEELLASPLPFSTWPERLEADEGPDGSVSFTVLLTVHKPKLNVFSESDQLVATKLKTKPEKSMKTPVKSKSKMRRATEEPKINMDGVKVKKSKQSQAKQKKRQGGYIEEVCKDLDWSTANENGSRSSDLIREKEEMKQRKQDEARRRAREKALELQKARLDSLAQEKARVFSKLDHMYTVMRKQDGPAPKAHPYEALIESLAVRPGYYIDCISGSEGIRSLLQRVGDGAGQGERCCGIPFQPPKLVFITQGSDGRKIVKMAPPTPKKEEREDEEDEWLEQKKAKRKKLEIQKSIMQKKKKAMNQRNQQFGYKIKRDFKSDRPYVHATVGSFQRPGNKDVQGHFKSFKDPAMPYTIHFKSANNPFTGSNPIHYPVKEKQHSIHFATSDGKVYNRFTATGLAQPSYAPLKVQQFGPQQCFVAKPQNNQHVIMISPAKSEPAPEELNHSGSFGHSPAAFTAPSPFTHPAQDPFAYYPDSRPNGANPLPGNPHVRRSGGSPEVKVIEEGINDPNKYPIPDNILKRAKRKLLTTAATQKLNRSAAVFDFGEDQESSNERSGKNFDALCAKKFEEARKHPKKLDPYEFVERMPSKMQPAILSPPPIPQPAYHTPPQSYQAPFSSIIMNNTGGSSSNPIVIKNTVKKKIRGVETKVFCVGKSNDHTQSQVIPVGTPKGSVIRITEEDTMRKDLSAFDYPSYEQTRPNLISRAKQYGSKKRTNSLNSNPDPTWHCEPKKENNNIDVNTWLTPCSSWKSETQEDIEQSPAPQPFALNKQSPTPPWIIESPNKHVPLQRSESIDNLEGLRRVKNARKSLPDDTQHLLNQNASLFETVQKEHPEEFDHLKPINFNVSLDEDLPNKIISEDKNNSESCPASAQYDGVIQPDSAVRKLKLSSEMSESENQLKTLNAKLTEIVNKEGRGTSEDLLDVSLIVSGFLDNSEMPLESSPFPVEKVYSPTLMDSGTNPMESDSTSVKLSSAPMAVSPNPTQSTVLNSMLSSLNASVEPDQIFVSTKTEPKLIKEEDTKDNLPDYIVQVIPSVKAKLKEFVKMKNEVKVETVEEVSKRKRSSAIKAALNFAEPDIKDEFEDQLIFSPCPNKRKCDRSPQLPSPKLLSPTTRTKTSDNSKIKLRVCIKQCNNRTYIRCRNKQGLRDHTDLYPVYVITSEDGLYVETDDPDDSWAIISALLQRIKASKHQAGLHGLAMWGLAHDSMIHLIEQLPNVHRLEEYSFHFPEHGPQRQLINRELPVPDGGSIRTTAAKRRGYVDQFAFLNHPYRNVLPPTIDDSRLAMAMGDLASRRTTSLGDLPMAMRYRHIMKTVKEVLCVSPSGIHGRGLYCKHDISIGEMIIEYSGTIIRPILCDMRERYYDSKGIGSYMFRIDRNMVVDATMSGSMARFINHSCDPNCYSRIINVDNKKKIIIFAERNIVKGEELTYDYKFPSEEVKIPCGCMSEKCRKWMN